jgi:hypothetical protein
VTVQIPEQTYYSATAVSTGGVALDPLAAGVTTATFSIPGLVQEANATTVTITAPGITANAVTVGAGLEVASSGSLGASQHGGVDVIAKILDPGFVLIAPDGATVGGDSLVRTLANGSTGFSYTIQALEGVADTGQVSVRMEVRAAGFTPDTVVHVVRRSGYRLAAIVTSTTTLSPDDPFYVEVGMMNAAGTAIQTFQNLRAGSAGLTATITSSVPGVGQLVTSTLTSGVVTVQIPEQIYYSATSVATGGVAFQPLTTGTTNVSASIPGLVAESNAANVVVSTPGITVSSVTVGSGLQSTIGVTLGASDYGDTARVVVKSSNPAVLLVSPNGATAGTDSIVLVLTNSQTSRTVYVQGVEFQTGSVLITARASGFTDGSSSSTVVTPALDLGGLLTSISTTAADDPFYVQVGIPNANNTGMSQYQSVRAGAPGPLVATVQTETSGYGQLVITGMTGTSFTVQIPSGTYYSPTSVVTGGVAFHPVAAGAISVFATIPTFIALPTATRLVTVTP